MIGAPSNVKKVRIKKFASLFLKKEILNTLKITTKLKKISDINKIYLKNFLIRNFSYVLSIFSFVIKD